MDAIFEKLKKVLKIGLVVSIAVMIVCTPFAHKLGTALDLLGVNKIAENIKNMELNMTSVVYAQNEQGQWEEYKRIHGAENRLWVSIDKMPDDLINAFIAIEDETFYKHSGINWKRTLGAVGNFIFKFDDTEFGGSTITQQLIKNVTQDNDRSALRKVREIIRAMFLEKKLTKTEILEAYLNTIALGNGICGVQVAANYYFNKDVSELDLSECVTIAAITQNPSRYNPITGMENNKERRQLVLEKMLELGTITSKELISTYDVKIDIDNTQKQTFETEVNDYFVDTLIEQVIEDLMEEYDCNENVASTMLYNGGYKIYSTVNPQIQEAMEEVYLNVDKYFPYKGENLQGETVHSQSAMTIMDYDGKIVGIVGGAGEKTVNRGLNRAYSVPRQPGSTMKPIGVYALAVENNLIHYTSKVVDKPIDNYYPDGKKGPKEWYGYYKGTITVDYAIRKSANTIPVILLKELGIDTSYDFLTKKLGMKYLNDVDRNLASLALGGCDKGITPTESAAAYAIFGNGGVYHKPTTYIRVERVNGEKVLKYDTHGEQVIGADTATIMNHLLQGVVYGSEGTGGGIRGYRWDMKAYAKTGTSSESNDLWMVAGTPYYVGSVWYGFDKMQPVNSTSAAATIWRDVMKEVHKDLEKKEFVDSEDVYKIGSGYYKKGTVPDNSTGYVSSESSSSQASSSNESSLSSEVTSSQSTASSENTTTSSQVSSDTSSAQISTESSSTETSSTETTSEVSSVTATEP